MYKFAELKRMMSFMGLQQPVLGSVYLLTPKAARIMNSGRVPGAVVPNALLRQVEKEWRSPAAGRRAAVDRAARQAAVLKGLGYKGIHIEGLHRNFELAARILDRMVRYEKEWRVLIGQVHFPQPDTFYAWPGNDEAPLFEQAVPQLGVLERAHYRLLSGSHDVMFDQSHRLAPAFRKFAARTDSTVGAKLLKDLFEDPIKGLLLGCRRCGDCAIQHVGFLCPESGCPKHMRNGACGGSRNGFCEVHDDRPCVWVRAYNRLSAAGKSEQLIEGCVPPRMWELDQTSAWLNFHLDRDHQGADNEIARTCRLHTCRLTANRKPY
jgi:methylenetetrahydrofolate reductase (NADPH)